MSEQTVTIRNPIVPGDHPDPSIVRVGADYYMVSSTFQFFPAVLVLHSRDLIQWKPIGHVVTRRSQLDLQDMPDSFGVYAPDISYCNGKFWVVVPYYHAQPRCTNLLFVADKPEGPYSEAIVLNHHFIDPSIFNDDDGKRYLLFGGGWVHELAADGSGLLGEAKQVWPGTGGAAPEGPHLVKRDGWYYLLLAEGGTFFGHMETIARSRSVWGPYEECPHNPILRQSDPQAAIQKAGHGKLVEDAEGKWWMVHLGGRPLTPEGSCPLGRETFLEPVDWTADGWPVVGDRSVPMERLVVPGASPVPDSALDADDRFAEQRELSPDWEWVRHPVEDACRFTDRGLELRCKPFIPFGTGDTLILTRRWRHLGFEATARLRFEPQAKGEEAGLTIYRDSDAFLFLSVRSAIGQTAGLAFDYNRRYERQEFDGLYLQLDQYVKAMRKTWCQIKLELEPGGDIELRVRLDEATQTLRFAYAMNGGEASTLEAELKADFVYPETVNRFMCFTAPRVGLFARGVYGEPQGTAVFSSFAYRGI